MSESTGNSRRKMHREWENRKIEHKDSEGYEPSDLERNDVATKISGRGPFKRVERGLLPDPDSTDTLKKCMVRTGRSSRV